MAKTVTIGFHVPPELKQRLISLARKEDRSISSLLRLIIRDWEQRQARARVVVDADGPYSSDAIWDETKEPVKPFDGAGVA